MVENPGLVNQWCGLCKYFESTEKDVGKCRRYPPQMVVLQESGVQQGMDPVSKQIVSRNVMVQKPIGFFPTMKQEDIGCGEFKAREKGFPEVSIQEMVSYLNKRNPDHKGEYTLVELANAGRVIQAERIRDENVQG